MYTFSKCKVKHLLLSMCALPPIRLVSTPGTVRSVAGRMCPRSGDCAPVWRPTKSPHSDIHCRGQRKMESYVRTKHYPQADIQHKRSATRRRAPFVKKLNVSSRHYLVPSFSVMSVGRIDTVMQLFCLSSTLLTKS